MSPYYNPYSGASFPEFFLIFFSRLWLFATGQIGFSSIASDEIQVFVLIGVSLSAASLGCFLVLRRMTMLANALSHTILLGIVGAYVVMAQTHEVMEHGSQGLVSMKVMLLASLAMGVITTFLTEFLTKHVRLQEDASIGIVFTSLFALGVILVTLLTRSTHIGTEVIMGNVDALSIEDLKLVLGILVMNGILLVIFYKEYLISTFDSALSNALGISTLFFNYLLMIQVSATAIGGFRAVGVLMVLAFMTGPPLTARLLTHNLKRLILLSGIIAGIASLIAVALSRHFLSVTGTALSTGGIAVCVIGALFGITALGSSLRRKRVRT